MDVDARKTYAEWQLGARVITPVYKHEDCGYCAFIGTNTVNGLLADVYVCPQNGLPTIIVRFSSSPADYTSRPILTLTDDQRSELAELLSGMCRA